MTALHVSTDGQRVLRALWREAERALNRVSPFAPIVTLNMDREARAAVERYFLALEHVLGNSKHLGELRCGNG